MSRLKLLRASRLLPGLERGQGLLVRVVFLPQPHVQSTQRLAAGDGTGPGQDAEVGTPEMTSPLVLLAIGRVTEPQEVETRSHDDAQDLPSSLPTGPRSLHHYLMVSVDKWSILKLKGMCQYKGLNLEMLLKIEQNNRGTVKECN